MVPSDAAKRIGASRDARLGWVLDDLLRFVRRSAIAEVVTAFAQHTGSPLPAEPFTAMGDRLLAWDLPAPPGYRDLKRDLFLLIEPAWEPFFGDDAPAIDWRLVGWGGVDADDRLDATQGAICPRGCIPALDQPKVTPAAQGRWYLASAIVFGVVINGEARACPKNMIMSDRSTWSAIDSQRRVESTFRRNPDRRRMTVVNRPPMRRRHRSS